MSKQNKQKLAIHKVAELIAGDNPPDWVITGISQIVYILQGNVNVENAQQSRGNWRQKFLKVKTSAQNIIDALLDKEMLPALLNASDEKFPYESETLTTLEAIISRCDEKIAGLPKSRGGKKFTATIDETPSGNVLCALAIQLAWVEIHGRFAGIDNRKAHDACGALWKMAGGKKRKWAPVSSWREQLREARQFYRQAKDSGHYSNATRYVRVLLQLWGCKLNARKNVKTP